MACERGRLKEQAFCLLLRKPCQLGSPTLPCSPTSMSRTYNSYEVLSAEYSTGLTRSVTLQVGGYKRERLDHLVIVRIGNAFPVD